MGIASTTIAETAPLPSQNSGGAPARRSARTPEELALRLIVGPVDRVLHGSHGHVGTAQRFQAEADHPQWKRERCTHQHVDGLDALPVPVRFALAVML